MRIISGSAKGRRLCSPGSPKHNKQIRPTSDRAREALFNIIGQDRLKNKSVLDLFAGTGAIGLEALSRGASLAFFVDNHISAIKLINENIAICGFASVSSVVKRDLEKGLFFFVEILKKAGGLLVNGSFDLIFIDPPYDKGQCEFFLLELQKQKLVNQESLIIFEDRSKQKLPSHVGKFVLCDQRKYGDTGFWFYIRDDCQPDKPALIKNL